MVAGDLVNTASRLQSAAEPGTVLVGEATRRATEQAIVYESAGEHELKGKAEPVALWRALRVVSGRRRRAEVGRPGGAVRRPRARAEADQGPLPRLRRRAAGAPRLGDRDRRHRQVAAAWEFYKYFDGIVEHGLLAPRPLPRLRRGRRLLGARGHGADALPDRRGRGSRRPRARSSRRRWRSTSPTPEERAFVEPRLAQLLGLDEAAAGDRQDLFAAWRLFFERLADAYPTVLAFEDMQWADTSLLDFVEYLLEWSRDYPLYVITLARPELHERRPGWGAGQRNFTSLYLEPLSQRGDGGAARGARARACPSGCATRSSRAPRACRCTRSRRCGCCSTAACSSRRARSTGRPGEIEALEVPETLHALIAARLDGLAPRSGGCCRTGRCSARPSRRDALAALSGISCRGAGAAALVARAQGGARRPVRPALARARPVRLPAGPRPPRRLRDALQARAQDPAPGRRRAPAERVRRTRTRWPRCSPRTTSPPTRPPPTPTTPPMIRAKAREMLARAGERAGSLGAPEEGQRYYEQAAELARGAVARGASCSSSAGRLASRRTDPSRRGSSSSERSRCYEEAGDTARPHGPARRSRTSTSRRARLEQAVARLEQALAELEQCRRRAPTLAAALAQLGRIRASSGHGDEAAEPLERALTPGGAAAAARGASSRRSPARRSC